MKTNAGQIENIFDFQIHYYLNQEDLHKMDAKTLNECERQLLDAFDFIKAYTGEFNIDVTPKKEGGLIETFVIYFVASNIGYDIIKNFFNALIQQFFSSTQTKLSNSIDRIKILEKIKNGTITKEEVMALVDDKKLRKYVSNYYKPLENTDTVISVEASMKKEGDIEPFCSSKIIKADFTKKILSDTTTEDKTETAGTTIRILSPVLRQGHGKVWKGYYSGKTIEFKVLDKEFLEQVYNNEIKFGANTVITCTLITITKKKVENGEYTNLKPEYAVKDVLQWEDDYTFKNSTKRYKKIKADEQQLDLFNQDQIQNK